jgi:hypothetical protein
MEIQMDEHEQEQEAKGATGEAKQRKPAIGSKVTDQLPESEQNYDGNKGNDTEGGPGAGTPPGNVSHRDATGGGAVSDTGSAAGAPIPTAKFPNKQGASGMGAAGSSADISHEDYVNTHEEDGSLTKEEQDAQEEQARRNEEAQEAENKRIHDVKK